jgi:phosphohistidine swiveling domain-containing protein
MRRIYLALGEQLVQRGAIDNRDDLFYLTREELHALTKGELASAAAKSLTAVRKAQMETDAQLELPSTICGEFVPMPPARVTGDQDYLTGIGGSSGWACGHARIVLEPTKAPQRLNNDDILVVPFSDVGWTPLFAGITGIVAETGGQLSHTSIIAREYGIPAVVSVRQATLLIHDGQPIAVDGTQGRVYLRDMAELRKED